MYFDMHRRFYTAHALKSKWNMIKKKNRQHTMLLSYNAYGMLREILYVSFYGIIFSILRINSRPSTLNTDQFTFIAETPLFVGA